MEDEIANIVPTIRDEMLEDGENESEELLEYYICCNPQEKAVVDNVLMYLCGWRFSSILKKCRITVDQDGNPGKE